MRKLFSQLLLLLTFLETILTKRWFFILVIVVLATVLRVHQWGYYPFGFDQIQMVENAEKILQGDPSLIGPRTGPADMFTGPLVYYWMAFWLMFVELPYTVVPFSVSLALITGGVLAWLSFRYLSKMHAQLVMILWAFSPFIVPFDRLPWNPNLTLLASMCVFFPTMYLVEKADRKARLVDYLILFTGAWLGYQAHFSGLLLPFLAIGILILFDRSQWKAMLMIVLGFLFSLVPTVIFDLRNDYLNTRGFLSLLSNKDEVSSFLIIPRLIDNVRISFETIGKVLFAHTTYYLALVAGLTVFGASLHLLRKEKNMQVQRNVVMSLIWILLVSLAFALYRLNKPEYYYFIELPAIFILISYCFQQVLNSPKKIWVFVVVAFGYAFTSYFGQLKTLNLEIANQVNVVDAIDTTIKTEEISEVVYDMDHLDSLGIQYLLAKREIRFDTNGKVLHVIYPTDSQEFYSQKFSNVALWIDPRNDQTRNYLTRKQYIISSPLEIELLQDHYSPDTHTFTDVFQVFQNKTAVGKLKVIFFTNKNREAYGALEKQLHSGEISTHKEDVQMTKWGYLDETKKIIFIYESDGGLQNHGTDLIFL